ncbi:MAG: GAF domain-containing protein, partial [Xanthobacteraceae bacterium]
MRRRTHERDEALERQTATAEVLKVISRTNFDLQSVLDKLTETAARLCNADVAGITRERDGAYYYASVYNYPPELHDFIRAARHERTRGSVTGRVMLDRKTVHVRDVMRDPEYTMREFAQKAGLRTALGVPLLREGEAIGVIVLARSKILPFTDKQIDLVTTFADQAVIAIENARLFEAEQQRTRELRESLQQQTATADVLKVISRSTFDLQPVLDTLVESATRLCEAQDGVIFVPDGDIFRAAARFGFTPEHHKLIESNPVRIDRGTVSGRAAIEGRVVHVADVLTDPEFVRHDAQKTGGFRAALGVPLLREGKVIGVIFLSRAKPQPFSEKQIELVTTFADQAVIAIENVRLFDEVQARTRELQEALDYQTATSDVLEVISRTPIDLQPVLTAICETVAKLCETKDAEIFIRDGERLRLGWVQGSMGTEAETWPITRGLVMGRAVLNRELIQVHDLRAASEEFPEGYQSSLLIGHRTIIAVPLMRKGEAVGVLTLRRSEVKPFTDKQITLLRTFADQAVIAIENARLLSELRQRTTDLSESLEQQTATSNVLEVISRSAFDLKAVFETVAESSVRLCGADRAFIWRFDGELLRMVVAFNSPQALSEFISQNPVRPGRGGAVARAALERRPVHIPDVLADPEYTYGSKDVEAIRTVLGVPILKGDELLGAMTIYHLEGVRPFTDKQIALVETFADQAAIAIDNFRLLDELRQRTDELGRSVSELQALGEVSQAVNSTLDLETVLSTIVAKAVQLSGTEAGAIYGYDEQWREFRLRATYGMDQALIEALTQRHMGFEDPTIAGVFVNREPTQVADLREEPASELNKLAMRAGYRARMIAPLLRGEDIVGMLVVRRRTPGEFPKNTVDIIKTFAAQSALAIQNARLFHEIEDKGRQLAEASQHKSQFLANMSHELRTPLNAILGYSELMADGAYGEPSEKMLGILKRLEANGKHLLGLINDVLDLSKIEAGQLVLDLSDYTVQDIAQTVRSTLEPLAADKKLAFKLELGPELPAGHGDGRRLTQVLINLVGNAIKFTDAGEVAIKAEANNGSFHVSVRDTGPGISAADQAKLFQEFQQADNAITKKKGGTGLG